MKTIAAVVLLIASLGTGLGQRSGFPELRDDFLRGYLAWRPLTATALGVHDYDGKITDYSRSSIEAERARLKQFEKQIAALDPRTLSREMACDRQILLTGIRSELFHFDDLAIYTRNPMTYAQAIDVNVFAKRNFAPPEERLRAVIAIERDVPKLFAAARANLDASLPKPYVEAAIEMAKGAAEFLSRDLVNAFKDAGDAALQKEFTAAISRAAAELTDFAAWLEREKLPSANAPYALGRDKFEKMLRETELIDVSSRHILDLGLKELRREQKVFADTARKIDPTRKPVDVFKEIQRDHPTEQSLIPDTRKDLDAIRQFVLDHHVVTIPSPVRAAVEETPQYLRATSFASMDTPGPFETKATEADYY